MALRPARPGDWKQLHRLCTDPAVAAGLDEIPFQPEEVFQKRLEEINPASTLALAAVDRDDGLVGCLWLRIDFGPSQGPCGVAVARGPSQPPAPGDWRRLLDAALSTADQWSTWSA